MNISKVSSTKKLKEDLQLARPKNSQIEYEMEWERFCSIYWNGRKLGIPGVRQSARSNSNSCNSLLRVYTHLLPTMGLTSSIGIGTETLLFQILILFNFNWNYWISRKSSRVSSSVCYFLILKKKSFVHLPSMGSSLVYSLSFSVCKFSIWNRNWPPPPLASGYVFKKKNWNRRSERATRHMYF